MRVLMLGWELPPFNSGGLGVACYQMCKALSKRNVSIEFVVPYSGHPELEFMTVTAAGNIDVNDVSIDGIAYDSGKYFMTSGSGKMTMQDQHAYYEHNVAKLCTKTQFDVIHAHDWLTFRAGVRAKTISGKPLIAHVHSVESDRSGGKHGNPYVHEIERMGLTLADRIIAVSQHTKKQIINDYQIPAAKIEVVHNSIDQETFEPLDSHNAYTYLEQMKTQGYKVVANIGRLTVQKNLHNLLEAAAIVINHQPKTIFLIVGTGELYYELIEQAARLGISKNVIFTGFLRGKEWRDAYAAADLFVMPSISEPFGLTPLEAAGYGTPSLISKQSGVAEILKSCLKVDYWDVNEMANQMVGVLSNEGLQKVLAQSATNEYYSLGWHNAADKLEGLYLSHTGAGAC